MRNLRFFLSPLSIPCFHIYIKTFFSVCGYPTAFSALFLKMTVLLLIKSISHSSDEILQFIRFRLSKFRRAIERNG